MINYDHNSDRPNNIAQTREGIRLSPQIIELHRARINNLWIGSIADICMVSICLIGLGFIIYYVIFVSKTN